MFSRRRFLDITGSVTAASILTALRPVRVAQAADEKDTWEVKGLFMEPLQLRGDVSLRCGKRANCWLVRGPRRILFAVARVFCSR